MLAGDGSIGVMDLSQTGMHVIALSRGIEHAIEEYAQGNARHRLTDARLSCWVRRGGRFSH